MVLRGNRSGAGSRNGKNPYQRKDRTKHLQVEPEWSRWVTTFRNFFVQLIIEERAEDEGPEVMFYVPRSHNGVQFAINFTDLSPEELDAVEGLLKSCIDLARPIVQHRDGKAKRNAEHGDDSNSRVYRALPTVVERPWARSLDGQGLLDRRTGFLPRDGGRINLDYRSRGYGSILAESDEEDNSRIESSDSSSQDDEPSINLAP